MSEERTETREGEATVEVTEEGNGGDVIVRCSKGNRPAKTGAKFAEEVMRIAKDLRLKKFRVFVDNGEITKGSAPDTIERGMQISLEPFDQAAIPAIWTTE